MKILSIGNSFSQDAQRYLSRVAKASGEVLHTTNLYIGGCSLERHYRNMLSGKAAYELECCGIPTGFTVSIKDALLANEYDVITLQQVSQYSYRPETFEPYIEELASLVRRYAPRAKLYLHRTWAYEEGSARINALGLTSRQMHEGIVRAYDEIAEKIGADGIIPAGDAMLYLMENGFRAHRDTFHASFGAGRYAIALSWLRTLTGKDPMENTFTDFDEPVSEEELLAARRAASV